MRHGYASIPYLGPNGNIKEFADIWANSKWPTKCHWDKQGLWGCNWVIPISKHCGSPVSNTYQIWFLGVNFTQQRFQGCIFQRQTGTYGLDQTWTARWIN